MVMSARSFKGAAEDVFLGLVFATWHVAVPTLAPNRLLVDSDGFHESPTAGWIPGMPPVASVSPWCGGNLWDVHGDYFTPLPPGVLLPSEAMPTVACPSPVTHIIIVAVLQ